MICLYNMVISSCHRIRLDIIRMKSCMQFQLYIFHMSFDNFLQRTQDCRLLKQRKVYNFILHKHCVLGFDQQWLSKGDLFSLLMFIDEPD